MFTASSLVARVLKKTAVLHGLIRRSLSAIFAFSSRAHSTIQLPEGHSPASIVMDNNIFAYTIRPQAPLIKIHHTDILLSARPDISNMCNPKYIIIIPEIFWKSL